MRELRVWLVGSATLAAHLSLVCPVQPLAPGTWQRRVRADRTADLLLVEGEEEVGIAWMTEIEALLEHCKRARVPRLLWITASPLDQSWARLSPAFDRVFSIDRDDLPRLEEAGARHPSPLWRATALPVRMWPPLDAHRPDAVMWLGGWRHEWRPEWKQRLAAVLEGAAAHGLTIRGVEDPDVFPASLRRCIDDSGPIDREAALRRARVVIGADPDNGSPRIAPSVVFDAIACGAAVVTPHGFAYYGAFSVTVGSETRALIPTVRDAQSTAIEIEQLLTDDSLRTTTVRHAREIVSCNHTFAHRVATLASAVGIRMIPNGLR